MQVQGPEVRWSLPPLLISMVLVQGSYSNLESKANGDGTFTTTCQIHKAGQNFQFDVLINDQPVGNSPLKISS